MTRNLLGAKNQKIFQKKKKEKEKKKADTHKYPENSSQNVCTENCCIQTF